MKQRKLQLSNVVLAGLTLLLAAGQPLHACSTFLFGCSGKGTFVARNYDWDCGEGLAVINKRGVRKRSLSFDNPVTWESRFGSVSFCQYGVGFPCDGMNEAGLMVTVLWLDEADYPQPDRRPSINTLQWVQYQLDTAKTVADVVASDKDVRIFPIAESMVHYFVADKTGDCATIEFLEGKMVCHRGEKLKHCALTNSTYQESSECASCLTEFGGTREVGRSGSSLDRYCRAALAACKQNQPEEVNVDYGFDVLLDLGPTDYTKWRIVYDLAEATVYFRTLQFPRTKRIQLNEFDPTEVTPLQVFDMNSPSEGDISKKFANYSEAQNRQVFTAALNETGVLEGFPGAKQLIEMVVRYPDSLGFATSAAQR